MKKTVVLSEKSQTYRFGAMAPCLGLGALLLSAGLLQRAAQAQDHESLVTPLRLSTDFSVELHETQEEVELMDAFGAPVDQPIAPKLRLVAEIPSPVLNQETLRASSLTATPFGVVVGFNREGEKTLGGLVTLQTLVPNRPRVTSALGFLNADIHSLSARDGQIYAVGTRTVTQADALPAFVARFDLDASGKLQPKVALFGSVPGYAATDVYVNKDTVYVTSGNNGGLSTLQRGDFSVRAWQPIADARSVAPLFFSRSIGVLSGTPGRVTLFNPAGQRLFSVPIGGAQIPESKSVLHVSGDLAVAAVGDGGVKILCTQDMRTVGELPAITLPDLPAAKTVTNAATLRRGVLYTANGEAGVYAYQVLRSLSRASQCGSVTLKRVGRLNLGAGFSANDIMGTRSYLFVANGLGGLKLISQEE